MKNKEEKSRRKFMVAGASLGAVVALGAIISHEHAEDEEVVLLTADGKLVKVAKKFLPISTGVASSNADLKNWMKSHGS